MKNNVMTYIISTLLLEVLSGRDIDEIMPDFFLKEKDDIEMFLYILENISDLEISLTDDNKYRIKAKTIEKNRSDEIDPLFLTFLNYEKMKGKIGMHLAEKEQNYLLYDAITRIIFNPEECLDDDDPPTIRKDIDYNKVLDISSKLNNTNNKWDCKVYEDTGSTVFSIEDSKKFTSNSNDLPALINLIKESDYFSIDHAIDYDKDEITGIRICSML